MSTEKPDQPWQMRGASPGFVEPSPYPTRLRAALAGMGRGAKIGFWAVAALGWFVELVAIGLRTVSGAAQAGTFGAQVTTYLLYALVWIPLTAILVGALPAAVLKGFVDGSSWRRPTDAKE